MKWVHDGPAALASECGRYMICRSGIGARGLVYTAVRLGKKDGKAWAGSTILASRTVSDERAAREAAVAQLQGLCEEHAGER